MPYDYDFKTLVIINTYFNALHGNSKDKNECSIIFNFLPHSKLNGIKYHLVSQDNQKIHLPLVTPLPICHSVRRASLFIPLGQGIVSGRPQCNTPQLPGM